MIPDLQICESSASKDTGIRNLDLFRFGAVQLLMYVTEDPSVVLIANHDERRMAHNFRYHSSQVEPSWRNA